MLTQLRSIDSGALVQPKRSSFFKNAASRGRIVCEKLFVSRKLSRVNHFYKLSQMTAAASTQMASTIVPSHSLIKATRQTYLPQTLTEYLGSQEGVVPSMVMLMQALQTAGKIIASRVARANIDGLTGLSGGAVQNEDRDNQKKLDVVANEVMMHVLAGSGCVAVAASEEEDVPVEVGSGEYVVVFDPLDGSSNIDASIPTGTIFGVYARSRQATGLEPAARALADATQPGSCLLASGYILYSSATIMVISVGHGTHAFTLDPQVGEFVLTNPNMRIPQRGQIYSLNDARYHDWPAGLQSYIDNVRQGKGQNPVQYSARYVCSLVADFHRTLLYGGWAGNPRSHLRLVYEANPLAFLVEQAGGKGSNGVRRVLDVVPEKLHHRLPLFLGSAEDISELESYGDVQQKGSKKYAV